MPKYKSPATALSGIMLFIQGQSIDWYKQNIKQISDLNPYLIEIRKESEPNKPVAKETEKNAIYIQKNISFKKVREYFNQKIKTK